jgi:hypothetical protein
MDVITQWVRTSWTKQSRGGPAATLRNAAPVGFTLPAVRFPLVHEVLMSEADGFEPHTSLRDEVPARSGVLLTEAGGRLRVLLVAAGFALPRRRQRPPAVWLQPGQWLRWQINYRFSWPSSRGGAWSYRLDTLNLAYGPTTAHAFTGEPTRAVDERTQLR